MSSTTNRVDWSKWDSKEDQFEKYRHVKSKLIYGLLPAKKPDVSIVIPTFRRAELLKDAIDSVLAQKTQYSFTITVVDNDGEIDQATDKLLKEYCLKYDNILYYRNMENIGLYGNWNRCIELAQAEWTAMLHDDDMLKENFIETMLTIAKKRQYGIIDCAPIYLDERIIDKKISDRTRFGVAVAFLKESFMKVRGKKEIFIKKTDISHGIFVCSPAHLIKTSDAISCGGYNDDYYPISDAVFHQKVIRHCTGAYVAQKLFVYRLSKNVSLNWKTKYNTIEKIAEWIEAAQQQGRSDPVRKRMYWEQIIVQYHTYLDTKNLVPFTKIKKEFKIPDKYCGAFTQFYIICKYILNWGTLFFRV